MLWSQPEAVAGTAALVEACDTAYRPAVRGNSGKMHDRAQTNGLHAFAFQTGEWRVHHRKLKRRLVDETAWFEFGGTCRAWELLGGAGNVEDHVLDDPDGPYRAAGLRHFDPATGDWSIHWVDARRPGLEPPVRGRFEDDVGLFFGVDCVDGRRIEVRFRWSDITADQARWEQAFSADGGASWEVNWIMTFERIR